jgi:cell division protein FtsB
VNWKTWIILCIFSLACLSLYYAAGQWKDSSALEGKLSTVKALNEQEEKENRELKEEIRLLRDDLSYIEEVARKDLGMVRKDDRVYRFVPPENK